MKPVIRCPLLAAALGLLSVAQGVAANPAGSLEYPSKPVRLIAPSPPGSPPDVVARLLGERLVISLGQPVVVDNRPGAVGTIGLNAVSKASPNGYTMGMMALAFIAAPSLVSQVPYDAATDLAPVVLVGWGSHVLVVRASSSLKSVSDILAFVKSRPGQLTFASGGNGTPAHLSGEFLRLRTGVDIRHVPFKGALQGVAAVLGEQVDIMFAASLAVAPHIQSGKLRALATPAPTRIAVFPELPTMIELGFAGFEIREWTGIVAPARTPKAIIAKMAGEVAKINTRPDMKERLAAIGMEPADESSPEAFGGLIRSELVRWNKVVREAGIRAD